MGLFLSYLISFSWKLSIQKSEKIKNLSYDDVKEGAIEKLDELKIKISELDQDKAREILGEKINDIKEKLAELSKYIKKKSAPTVKKIIKELSIKLDNLSQTEQEE